MCVCVNVSKWSRLNSIHMLKSWKNYSSHGEKKHETGSG